MKILYLLFAFLFLAFLSEPGNAQTRCKNQRGECYHPRCRPGTYYIGKWGCPGSSVCCRRRSGK